MKKGLLLLIIGIISLGIFAGCSGQSTSDKSNDAIQTVKIDAREWEFTPNTTTVKPGKVKFVIENTGTRMHGFAIDELGIKENIGPGQTIEKIVTVEQPTELTYYCTVLCGDMDQHNGMAGTLKVQK